MSGELTVFKGLMERSDVKERFKELLGKRSASFMTSVIQMVAQNDQLVKCEPMSIVQCAVTAAAMNLPINPNLGFAYIIPYQTTNKAGQQVYIAQFQMGYKGFIQLAQRTGLYKTIAAAEIYEGELVEANPLTGYVFDFTKRKSNTVIGVAAYFSLLNGFEKTFYMTVDELKAHGIKYSKTFKKGRGLWKDDFGGMGKKTVLKLMLSKFGPLSIDMERALLVDQSLVRDAETLDVSYVDNEEVEVDKEQERVMLMIQDANTLDELLKVSDHVQPELQELFNTRFNELQQEKEAQHEL